MNGWDVIEILMATHYSGLFSFTADLNAMMSTTSESVVRMPTSASANVVSYIGRWKPPCFDHARLILRRCRQCSVPCDYWKLRWRTANQQNTSSYRSAWISPQFQWLASHYRHSIFSKMSGQLFKFRSSFTPIHFYFAFQSHVSSVYINKTHSTRCD